jgi:flagellar motor switch protein FliN/FliY
MLRDYVKSTRKSLDMEQLQDLRFQMIMELGSTMITVRDLLNWQKGAIVKTDKVSGGNVDLQVNGKILAKGEVVVMTNNHFGFRLVTLLSPEERLKSL